MVDGSSMDLVHKEVHEQNRRGLFWLTSVSVNLWKYMETSLLLRGYSKRTDFPTPRAARLRHHKKYLQILLARTYPGKHNMAKACRKHLPSLLENRHKQGLFKAVE